jgi:hypothetical protein
VIFHYIADPRHIVSKLIIVFLVRGYPNQELINSTLLRGFQPSDHLAISSASSRDFLGTGAIMVPGTSSEEHNSQDQFIARKRIARVSNCLPSKTHLLDNLLDLYDSCIPL